MVLAEEAQSGDTTMAAVTQLRPTNPYRGLAPVPEAD